MGDDVNYSPVTGGTRKEEAKCLDIEVDAFRKRRVRLVWLCGIPGHKHRTKFLARACAWRNRLPKKV
jgi:hypothetical protein